EHRVRLEPAPSTFHVDFRPQPGRFGLVLLGGAVVSRQCADRIISCSGEGSPQVSHGFPVRGLLLLGVGGMLAAGASLAQAPRVAVEALYSPSSAIANATAGGDLQAALEVARPQDTVRAGNAWIRVLSLTSGEDGGRRIYTLVPPRVAAVADRTASEV